MQLKKQCLFLITAFTLMISLTAAASAAEAGTWTTVAPMSTSRYGFQSEVIDGKIYAFGGENGVSILSSMELYDPVADTWIAKAPMLIKREDFLVEVVDGKIYAIGGPGITSTEMYDPLIDK